MEIVKGPQMDVDACLKEIRELIETNNGEDLDSHDTDRLCELVASLDEFLVKDGRLPKDWL